MVEGPRGDDRAFRRNISSSPPAAGQPRCPASLSNGDPEIGGGTEAACRIPQVPPHLVVVGGGYIGMELGSVWNRLRIEGDVNVNS